MCIMYIILCLSNHIIWNDRHQIMMKCWETAPEDRPSFKELHKVTSKYTEHIAGYLEIGYNPFTGMQTAVKENEPKDEENECECADSFQEIPPSVDTWAAQAALNDNEIVRKLTCNYWVMLTGVL